MKQKIILTIVLGIISLVSLAQQIEYVYDDAGNRTARNVIAARAESVKKEDDEAISRDKSSSSNTEEMYSDALAEKELRIYPNPTRGKLAVEIINYDLTESGSLQIFDMGGRLIKNYTSLSERMEIDITNQAAGSYIMIVVIGNEKSEWRIVKQ
ncbi:MAG: T9SS type A sorting domain-containing protein [Bacteroidales bacterium]|nr:T9SS type A sorting domain-containing protein [Bacteroidales bacterium]